MDYANDLARAGGEGRVADPIERSESLVDKRAGIFFPNLDGLRFVAFFLVYLQHGFGIGNAAASGVAFFFVLSGFLITYLLLEEVDVTGQIDVLAFYMRRALRIWPLYYAVLLFAFVIYPGLKTLSGFSDRAPNSEPLLYLFFLSNFDVLRPPIGQGAGFTNVTWSVAVEEQFYLLWPLLFRLVPRKGYVAIFPSVIAASFAFRLLNEQNGGILYFHSLSVVSDMAMGGMAAYLWRNSTLFRGSLTGLSRAFVASIYLVATVTLYLASGFWGPYARIIAALFFVFVLLEQNFCPNSFYKIGRSTLLSELGRCTYGLYLLHMIVLTMLEKTAIVLHIDGSASWKWISAPAGLVLSVVVARISYLYFESPFIKLKGRFARATSLPTPSK